MTLVEGVGQWLVRPRADDSALGRATAPLYGVVTALVRRCCCCATGRWLADSLRYRNGGRDGRPRSSCAACPRWYGNVVAVNDITMTLGPGVTGLLGPNGAGKTTVLHMMAGFLPPSRGEVTVGGAAGLAQPGGLRRTRPGQRAGGGARLPHRLGVRAAPAPSCTGCPTRRRRPGGRIELVEMTDAQDRRMEHLLQGHAPAHPGRRGAGARPGGAAARRAVQRHGPAPAHAHDGAAARHGRRRAARCCSARTSWRRSSRSPAPCR